jgi:hypothetical protein
MFFSFRILDAAAVAGRWPEEGEIEANRGNLVRTAAWVQVSRPGIPTRASSLCGSAREWRDTTSSSD